MRTEEEILKKYEDMLKHTEWVMSIIENEPDLTNHQIEVMICEQNAQHQMNAIMRWVLNIKQ
jgi:hypothetical protein